MQDFHDEQELASVYDTKLLGQLLAYARPHAPALAGCVGLLLMLTALQLVQPYLIKQAIDQVMTPAVTGDPASRAALAGHLWPLAALYMAAAAIAAGLEYAQGVWLRVTGQAIIARIRQDLFTHLTGLDLAFYDANPAGRLVTRVTNDVEALNEMYTSVLVNLFKDCFLIAGAVIVMLGLDQRLALASFTVIPLVAVTAIAFQRLGRKAWRVVRARLARINATLAENLSGMRVIQVFAREARQAEEFAAINESYFAASMHQLRVYAVFRPLLELITTLALVAIVWIGGAAALAGALSFGTLYAFTSYSRKLYEPINALAEKYNILQSALASAERIFQLLGTAPAIADPATVGGQSPDTLVELRVSGQAAPPSVAPAIAFEDVWFHYGPPLPEGEEPHWVLHGVSFSVPVGATVAFVGHTGAGKSTIMSLVARFYDVQLGRVLVDGIDVREWRQADLRRRVGTVMQDVFLFAGDVADNISLGDPAIDRAAVAEAARVVGADRFIAALPGGLAEPVVERGMTLSAGQRQLIAFARALAYDPAVLVLDEATAHVDSETEEALQKAMRSVGVGRTMLVVAHRLSTIQGADRIYVMHKGRIREAGTHAALVAEGGLYARLWQLQFMGTGNLSPSG